VKLFEGYIAERGYELLADFEILGQPPSKSNRRQIVTAGRGKKGRPMLIKSKEARDYVESFIEQAPEEFRGQEWGSLDDDLAAVFIVWFTSRRPDLTVEMIKDSLEDAEVIKNDRYIREEFIFGYVDKENPRARILLYRINEDKREIPVEE
jgi:hypothetical protein